MKIKRFCYKWSSKKKLKDYFKKIVIPFFNNECVCCSGYSNLLNVELDHIKPKSLGGKDRLWNFQPLCALCNVQKGQAFIDFRVYYAKKNNLIIPSFWLKKTDNYINAIY
jgi:5-methylcytosine-specific restriction endonuclease McrA